MKTSYACARIGAEYTNHPSYALNALYIATTALPFKLERGGGIKRGRARGKRESTTSNINSLPLTLTRHARSEPGNESSMSPSS